MNYKQLLHHTDLGSYFYIKYAVACAEYSFTLVKEVDPRSLAGVAMAKRVGNGEDVPQKESQAAANAAANVATYPYNVTAAAYYAANAAAYNVAAVADYTSAAASWVTNGKDQPATKILINLLHSEFTKLELSLMFNKEILTYIHKANK